MNVFDRDAFDDAVFDCDIGVPNTPYWGSHFPDASGTGFHWGPDFPDGVPAAGVIQPHGVGGAATFLLLQRGTKITYSWATDVRKMWSGKEYRTQLLDDPKRTIVGVATLLGDDTRTMRARLARFAAIGSTFLLGLPFESVSIRADSMGVVVPTTTTTKSDWMQVGQRVIVSDGVLNSMSAVVQAFDGTSVTLDLAPGLLGRAGGLVMPAVPVFFEPTMTFTRFRSPTSVENWNLSARAAVFGFPQSARAAFASLAAATGALHAAFVTYWKLGPSGNAFILNFTNNGSGAGNVTVFGAYSYSFHYQAGVTTVAQMIAALTNSSGETFIFSGSYDSTATLTAGDALFGVQLANGSDSSNGPAMGAGATVATYAGRPVWDRGIQVEETAADSIQSLAEIVDLGGLPISIGTAKQADWGRAVYLKRTSVDDWQWIKAFLAAVRGRQRAFWLASFRADLMLATNVISGSISATAVLTACAGALHNAIISITTPGTAGNAYSIRFVGDGYSIPFLGYDLTNSGHAYTFHFTPGTTTVGTMIGLLASRGFTVGGTYTSSTPLSSGGNDEVLSYISFTGGADTHLTVYGPSESAGGIDAWFPSQRDRLQLRQVDGAIMNAQIISVVDNYDGTQAVGLALDTAPSAAAVDLVSWLELVRFDSDDFDFTFIDDATFSLQTTARVVQQ